MDGRQPDRSRSCGARAAALLALVVLAGCFPDARPRVLIEWGVSPETFEGADVEIDGKVVGKLQKFGAATRTAFPVDKGDHTVRVLHPKFDCEPFHYDAVLNGDKLFLLLDFAETQSPSGKPGIYLRR